MSSKILSSHNIDDYSLSQFGSKETPNDLARQARYKTVMLWLYSLIRDLISLQKITFSSQNFCGRSNYLSNKSKHFTLKQRRQKTLLLQWY